MKRMKRFMPATRLFYKILLYFLSLLIPIVVIGIVTYANFVAKYKRDFIENARLSLHISADQVDAHLRTVQEAGISFFNEPSVNRLLKPDSRYTLEDRSNLIDILHSLKRTGVILTEFAEDLFMFIDYDKVYTTSGIDDFDAFFDRSAMYESFGSDYWKRTIEADKIIEILEPSTLHASGKKVVPVVISRMVRGYNAVLVANIPVPVLQKKLKGYAPYPSTQFVALDGYGRVVLGPEQTEGGETDLIGKLAGTFHAGKTGSSELSLGGTPYIASYVQSDLFGWKLYALTPVSEFNRQASGILRMIVMICLVLVVIGLLFSFLFTFKLYTPIQRIKDALADGRETYDESEPAVNEFDEIGIGIRRLIRHNMKFESELNSVWLEYMDQTLLRLLKDRETPNEAELNRLFRDHLGFAKDRYRCCSIHFQFKDAFYEQLPDEDRVIVWSKLKKLIWSFLSEHFRLYVLECTRHLYVCVIEPDEAGSDEAGLRKALDSFMQTFQFDFRYCIVHVGIGQVHPGVKGIAESYKEAIMALQYREGNRDCEIIPYDRLDIRPNVLYTFTDEIKLLNKLKAGEPELKEKIGQFVHQQENRSASSHALGVLITDLYRTGLRFVMEQGLERERLIDEERHRLLGESGEWPVDLDAKKKELFDFYDRLAAELNTRQQAYKTNTLIAAITEMIETEYDRELYLESISDRLGMSPKYVSRIFKEKTGMNITQYMNMIRVNRAKQLLADTDLTIGDIAEKVGIHNRTTFLRIFKKTEGVTPQSYRSSEAHKRGTEA
ncbi:helix-turn-helix domain-containing protein [Paenibacillus mesophilus]|uniref:helix-turn-helix domain-containing protein n=1 Tax=Paenibacillus mesophilus TaxID=2582849 RepID=UPI00110E6831|nr:helix-turn-helix domain-containing protein [Paenibacillus mesophilus]TMV46869.1 helix-turn-helix domain-containing protein [Paenibacillus mesophilus]